jgi:hypothetical protein
MSNTQQVELGVRGDDRWTVVQASFDGLEGAGEFLVILVAHEGEITFVNFEVGMAPQTLPDTSSVHFPHGTITDQRPSQKMCRS